MKNTLRLLIPAVALTLTAAACSSGTHDGDTNVERGYNKKGPAAKQDGQLGADSITAGIPRPDNAQPTGKELLKEAGEAKDRNHDGVAD